LEFETMAQQVITLGGGCFWCTEAVFLRVRGVIAVESGYCNGQVAAPSYEAVCTGQTGCVEVVRVSFDDAVVSLRQVLELFMATHDPTTLNRQGHDVGTQYRSGIYYENEAQQDVALAVVREAQAHWDDPIVTEVMPISQYSRAEEYHQNYFARHPQQGYCAAVIAPKVAKLRRSFEPLLKAPDAV